LTCTSGTGVP